MLICIVPILRSCLPCRSQKNFSLGVSDNSLPVSLLVTFEFLPGQVLELTCLVQPAIPESGHLLDTMPLGLETRHFVLFVINLEHKNSVSDLGFSQEGTSVFCVMTLQEACPNAPWSLTFSYGRALQSATLKVCHCAFC